MTTQPHVSARLTRAGGKLLFGITAAFAIAGLGMPAAVASESSAADSAQVLIASVSGDSLADVLERSEALTPPDQLAAYLGDVADELAAGGEAPGSFGLSDVPVDEARALLADAQASIDAGGEFSEAVEKFPAVPLDQPTYLDDAAGESTATAIAPLSADDPATPSEYVIWGEAFNSNHSWKIDSTFKVEDCEFFGCTDIDKLVVTTVVDPGQFATRVTLNQLYFPNQLGYFSSPEIKGRIYLPTAPAAAERIYTIVNPTGEFYCGHVNTDGKTFIMGFRVSVPTDGGDYWTVVPRTRTATCASTIAGFCQWWV